ncbi:MAG: IscS subfamily cysteine desulfurase [Ottowia sp.]
MAQAAAFPIYLDNAATTRVDPRVVDAMMPWLGAHYGNPASTTHRWGWDAARAVEKARAQVAALIGADSQEIIWTSGATESNNLALLGGAAHYQKRGRHIVTVATEHKAVLDTVAELERQGLEVTILGVDAEGLLDAEAFTDALRPDTVMASVMLVNNEIGVIQDVAALGAICRRQGVLFHVDAAQATGKVPIRVHELPVDLMSLTAHKTHGPKGMGALYVSRRQRVHLHAQMHGGGHERGMRSGTLATHQIVGMGEAFRIAAAEMDADEARAHALRRRLLDGLQGVPGWYLNGDATQRVPQNINLRFDGVDGEALMLAMPDVAVSTGSACDSADPKPSHVLRALGLSDEQASASLRLSLGRFTTEAEVDAAVHALRDAVARLRQG